MRAILIVPPGEAPAAVGDTAPLHVRVAADGDLRAALASRPAGLAIPVPAGGRDVARLGARLAVHEAEADLADGSTRILALVETAAAALALPTLVGASPRLSGIAWDADALARDIGAPGSRDADGVLIPPLAFVRAQVVLSAAAAGVAAVDTACAVEGVFMREVEEGRRDGFEAKVVQGPDQVSYCSTGPGKGVLEKRAGIRSDWTGCLLSPLAGRGPHAPCRACGEREAQPKRG